MKGEDADDNDEEKSKPKTTMMMIDAA